MNHPLVQLFVSQLRQHFREPQALFWVYGFPLIMAVGLGVAFSGGRRAEAVRVDIVGDPESATVRELHDHLKDLKEPKFEARVFPEGQARQRLRTDKTSLVVIPAGDGFRFVYDPANEKSAAARDEVRAALVRWKAHVSEERPESSDGQTTTRYTAGGASSGGWQTTDVPVSEPGSRYIDFLIPGLMGLNVMGSGLFGVGFFLVDMRVRKLLKRLVATPMKRSHFLLAVLGTRLLLLVPQMGLLLIVARLAFGVQVFGSWLAVAAIVVLGSFAFSGIGLVLASRTDKIETISGLVNLVMLPGWLLSGTFFSAERFPAAAQPVIQALPLTQLNDALRSVMLDGQPLTGPGVAWRVAALAAWGVVSFLLALKWFRWQ
jgi:ABC-type multidrug transport system permease subunit